MINVAICSIGNTMVLGLQIRGVYNITLKKWFKGFTKVVRINTTLIKGLTMQGKTLKNRGISKINTIMHVPKHKKYDKKKPSKKILHSHRNVTERVSTNLRNLSQISTLIILALIRATRSRHTFIFNRKDDKNSHKKRDKNLIHLKKCQKTLKSRSIMRQLSKFVNQPVTY